MGSELTIATARREIFDSLIISARTHFRRCGRPVVGYLIDLPRAEARTRRQEWNNECDAISNYFTIS